MLTSCATLTNKPFTEIIVKTTKRSTVIYGSAVQTRHNKVELTVPQQNEPLEVTVITDSISKKVSIKPINSFAYYGNIFTNYGIGMLVDRKNPKRYGYPTKIYVDPADTSRSYGAYGFPPMKGDVRLTFTAPYVNSFHLVPDGYGAKDNTGFMGLSGGVDYFYSDKHFINVSAAGVIDLFIPFPAPVDFAGEREVIQLYKPI